MHHSASPPPAYTVDTRVGPYALVEEIGVGGMGSVWRASRIDGMMQRDVAVKLINLGMRTVAMRERFARERQILATLNHPNIARLYDAGVTDRGQPYLVLELVDGERIDSYCDRLRMPIAARIKLYLQVLAAVSHAHAHLIVHRDLKPGNIMVTANGEVKLLDFGISKLLDEAEPRADVTQEARVLTPDYASPEQLTNQPVTTASDIYALGVLLYQLLTGCLPYGAAARTPASLAKAIVEIDPPQASQTAITKISSEERVTETVLHSPTVASTGAASIDDRAQVRGSTPAKLRHVLAGDIDNILAKALKKDPYERYATVAEMADDLAAFLDLKPVKAQPDSLRYRAVKFTQRHRGAVAAAGLTVLAVLTGTATTTWQAIEARKQAAIAQAEASKANAIRDYMVDMFRAVGRESRFPKRGETTAKELLDDASARVQNSDPAIRDYLNRSFSEMYVDLDDITRAQRITLAWLNDTQARRPANFAAQIQAELAMALIEQRTGDANAALARITRVREQLKASGLERSEEYAAALNTLSYLEGSLGNDRSAKVSAERALAVARTLQRSDLVADALLNYASACTDIDEFDAAEKALSELVRLSETEFGPKSKRVADAWEQFGNVAYYKQDWKAAGQRYKAAMEIFETLAQDNHRDLILVGADYAVVLAQLGQIDEAAALRKRIDGLARARYKLTPSAGFMARVLKQLSISARAEGASDEAVRYAQEAIAVYATRTGKPLPINNAGLKLELAHSLSDAGALAQAAVARDEAVAVLQTQLADGSRRSRTTLVALSALSSRLGEFPRVKLLVSDALKAPLPEHLSRQTQARAYVALAAAAQTERDDETVKRATHGALAALDGVPTADANAIRAELALLDVDRAPGAQSCSKLAIAEHDMQRLQREGSPLRRSLRAKQRDCAPAHAALT